MYSNSWKVNFAVRAVGLTPFIVTDGVNEPTSDHVNFVIEQCLYWSTLDGKAGSLFGLGLGIQ